MRIVLLGKDGQLGWELQRALAPLGELVALGRCGAQPQADLRRPDELAVVLKTLKPDVIVNAAAYTDVDLAEVEPHLAQQVNADAVGVLAREAATQGAWLVHYSTDYVFDGSGETPWREGDPTGPLNVYGATKLRGEQLVRDSGCLHVILRTGWLHSPHGRNFARSLLARAAAGEPLSAPNDQFGAPTGADLVADVTAQLLQPLRAEPALGGTYHLAASGETSRHGYACHLIAAARRSDPVAAVHADTLSAPARRPANCRLDTRKLQRAFGLTLPDWRVGLDRLVAELATR